MVGSVGDGGEKQVMMRTFLNWEKRTRSEKRN